MTQLHNHEKTGASIEITLSEFCRVCVITADKVIEYVDYSIIKPSGEEPASWRFGSISICRAQRALRMQIDLGLNTEGVALALDLLDEVESLRAKLQRYESHGL